MSSTMRFGLRLLLCIAALAAVPSCKEEDAAVVVPPQPPVAPKDYRRALDEAVAGADRLVVKPYPMPGRTPPGPFEVNGADKVRQFLSLIEIDVERSGGLVPAIPEFTFLFYRGGERLVSLHPYGDAWLDWYDGRWDGCALLTPASQAGIPGWFKDQGYPDLSAAREARLAEERAEQQEMERFVGCFPEAARPILTDRSGPNDAFVAYSGETMTPPDASDQTAGERLAAAVGDGRTLAVASFRALGGRPSTWSSAEPEVRKVLAAVRAADPAEFLAATQDVAGDRVALLGAARVFFREGAAERVAEPDRDRLAALLGQVALTDGVHDNKPLTLRRLATLNGPAARALLRDVAAGRAGREIDRAAQPTEEPGVRAGAALALARAGDREIAGELARLAKTAPAAPDVAAAEVGLALLGDPEALKQEHFELASGVIGFAALDAIERFKGAHGLDVLVAGALDHPWAAVSNEAVLTFQRVTGQDFTARRPGAQERYCAPEVRAWWAANGATFVQTKRGQPK